MPFKGLKNYLEMFIALKKKKTNSDSKLSLVISKGIQFVKSHMHIGYFSFVIAFVVY